MLYDEVKELLKKFKPFEYMQNYLKVRFFLILFPYSYALDYLLSKLSCNDLENYFDCLFKKEFKFKLGAFYDF